MLVYSNHKVLYSGNIIRTLKTKFRSLKAQGLWIPDESKKVDTEGDLSGIKLFINKLVKSQKRGKTGRNG